MERRQKEQNWFLFDLAYLQITKYTSYPYLNLFLVILHHVMLLMLMYNLIQPDAFPSLLPFSTIFLVQAIIIAFFFGLTLLSYNCLVLNTIWVYMLLILQAVQVVYSFTVVQCFTQAEWCQGDTKMQIGAIGVGLGFIAAIILRSYCYCPFYQTSNPLSMNTGRMVLYQFIYTIALSIATTTLVTPTISSSKQLTFLLTLLIYALSSDPPTCSPLMSRGTFVCTTVLAWTAALIWILPLCQEVIGHQTGSIWFYWGFSTPIIAALAYHHSHKFQKGYEWRSLFYEDKNRSLRDLYLQVNEIVKVVSCIKKSQLRTNSSEFRQLWSLILNHNQKCRERECPLLTLQALKSNRQDQLVQQKRFNKTLQKSLEFALQHLNKQHDTYPNLLDLSLQIANFQLEVFHLRTKGLQLFNREYGKGRSSRQQWGVFYLKKKIQGFEGSGQAGIGQKEEQIESFKHSIEVSVSMLAEFWYFLSDPKCNIKKLYDLANVLFPLKIGVDEAWRTVKQLKNIESYHLYAKYLIRMFNDKERGIRILQQAQRLQAEAHEKEEVLAGNEAGFTEQHGVIFLQFDGKNSGIMYQVNNACEKMFGYNKGELQGRKVNDIMPKLFSVYHDRILENYQQTNRPRMMNKDRSVWGRAKDGYLFPFTICIKPVRNYFSQTSEVYASLKRDLWMKQKAFFFVDQDLNLSDLSASMISLYPDVASRIHLRKKIHLSEILPQHNEILPKLVQYKQTFEQTISRTFVFSPNQSYTETTTFGIQAQQVSVGVAGNIGYYFRMFKGSGLTSYDSSLLQNNQKMIENKDLLLGSSNARRDFSLIGSVSQNGSKMVYQGGLVRNSAMYRSQMLSRISEGVEQERQMNQSQLATEERVDYSKQIKIKRLQGTIIREIHELSEDSELDRGGPDNNQDEGSMTDTIKPVELNAILERQTGNRPISILKMLTVIMLAVSTLLVVLQYAAIFNNKEDLVTEFERYNKLQSLNAQIMALNMYAVRFQLATTYPPNGTLLAQFLTQINILDFLVPSLPLDVYSWLRYSDNAKQQMLLAFAVNKLISEAQVIAAGGGGSAQLFFIQYNSVNGLNTGCETGQKELSTQIQNIRESIENKCLLFFVLTLSLFLVLLLAKNIIVRQVLLKKAQILNIFFQIPRYSCSSIQKECERFIQRLSADNDEDDLQVLQSEEGDDAVAKKHSQQKKRTIMGEEKTSANFVVVSLVMLCFLVTFPLMVMVIERQANDQGQFVVTAGLQAVRLEKQLAKMLSFLNTHTLKPSYPLQGNTVPLSQIKSQHNRLQTMLASITSNFFFSGKILDKTYLERYNQLFYTNLCSDSGCQSSLGEDRGLNNIIFGMYDYLIGKYQTITNYGNTSYDLSVLYSDSIQARENSYRLLLKKHWRELQITILKGIQRFFQKTDALYFGIMLTVCILNCTLLLWGWISFYNELQKKIIATEYILTFIPIDEINKNHKIVKYIKEQVLRLQ